MRELWDVDYKKICEDWDNIYQVKYMEYAAQNGLGEEAHMAAITTAFEHATNKVMKKYKIKLNDLEKVINQHSTIIKKDKKSTKVGDL